MTTIPGVHITPTEGDAIARYQELIDSELRQNKIDYGSQPGLRALHIVARIGDVEVARALLHKGADINAPTSKGLTPLHYAVIAGKTTMIKYLCLYGADVNAQATRDGKTPLYTAAERGEVEIAKVLLDNGADPGIPDQDGVVPKDVASNKGHCQVLCLLEDCAQRCLTSPPGCQDDDSLFRLVGQRRREPSPPSRHPLVAFDEMAMFDYYVSQARRATGSTQITTSGGGVPVSEVCGSVHPRRTRREQLAFQQTLRESHPMVKDTFNKLSTRFQDRFGRLPMFTNGSAQRLRGSTSWHAGLSLDQRGPRDLPPSYEEAMRQSRDGELPVHAEEEEDDTTALLTGE